MNDNPNNIAKTVLAGCLALVLMVGILASGLFTPNNNNNSGGNTQVSWTQNAPVNNDDGLYYMGQGSGVSLSDGGIETHLTINNPRGWIQVGFDNAASVLTITGGDVHFAIADTSSAAASIDWSAVTNTNNSWVEVNSEAGQILLVVTGPAWSDD